MRARSIDEELVDCVQSIYASVLIPDRWSQAISRINRLVHGSGAAHLVSSPDAGTLLQCSDVELDPDAVRDYAQWAPVDLRWGLVLHLPVGGMSNDARMIGRDEFERSAVFNAKTGCRSHVDLAKTLMMTAIGRN